MDVFEEVVRYANIVLFGTVAFVCIMLWRRRRDAQAAWLAAAFASIGAATLLSLFTAGPDEEPTSAQLLIARLLIVAILGYPYFLFRFAHGFRPFHRFTNVVALVAAVALAMTTLFIPGDIEERSPAILRAFLISLVAYWASLGIAVGVRMLRGAKGQPRVARRRMQLVGIAATLFGLVLVPSAFFSGGEQPIAVRVFTQLLAPATAVLFAVGFATPRWLRAIWRRPEEEKLRRLELLLLDAATEEDVVERLVPHAARLVGGERAELVSAEGAVHPEMEAANPPRRRVDVPLGGDRVLRVWTSAYAPFVQADEENLLGTLGAFATLVLQRVELLEAQKRSRGLAEQASRELETLVYGLSHDLKSPIISIIGYLDYVKEESWSSLNDDTRHFLSRIEVSARYMEALVSDLLELSRIGRVDDDIGSIELEDVVRDVAGDLSSRHSHLTVEVEPDLPSVRMSRHRARQVFTNIIENAGRHGQRDPLEVRISAEEGDGEVHVVVADNGVGIPAPYRERVFGIFERLEPTSGPSSGTGVGLALVRKIMERLGGRVALDDVAVGASVRLVFPLSAVVAGDDGVTTNAASRGTVTIGLSTEGS